MPSRRYLAAEAFLRQPFTEALPGLDSVPPSLVDQARTVTDQLVTADASWMVNMRRLEQPSCDETTDMWDRTASASGIGPHEVIIDLWEAHYPHVEV